MQRRTQDEKKKDRLVKLKGREGQSSMAVEHEWSGSFEFIRRFGQFRDKLEALCGLPGREELPRILDVSTTKSLPAIWRRARLSPLEEKAIDIFAVLVFSSKKRWCNWLREFFRHEGWQIELRGRGRPRLDPRDEGLLPVMRGLQIEKIIARLKPGYLLKAQAKSKGGYDSDEEQIAKRAKGLGYDEQEAKAIVEARSVRDAAFRYFCKTQGAPIVSCKSIRNDYAKFKQLKRQFPSFFANAPLADT